ncbi:dethiobiotin synthase [Undibacterium sp. Jales W-56]|uniref:dethiobiotin synthase n=1 Tax=Undibacterium sp. Jales W-56 TaxID=2897325 RepID=UPI0021D22E78|nr:dethiobiotin synthase [Undibacterium sp. Jales W-56]MCU6434836.1 dethiobiotin synthase [Undibacterium sp. Jales W-56]
MNKNLHLRPHDYFVTGTDTEIGKTLVSAALLHAMAQREWRSVGMKPVAAGADLRDGVLHNEDVDALIAASSVNAPLEWVCPYLMQTPAAPHIVAQREQVTISLPHVSACYRQLTQLADAVVVEGVGGFCVPLNAEHDTADMAQQLGLPVILVVGLRLGCINHALLSAAAIAARGLRLAGWVANTVDPGMLYPADNIAALQARLAAPLIGQIPRLDLSTDTVGAEARLAQRAAAYLDLNLLK